MDFSLNYKDGLKQGWKIFYNKIDSGVSRKEFFVNDTINELYLFFNSGKIKKKVLFSNGLKHGLAFEYDSAGLEQSYCSFKYDKGVFIEINRKDKLGQKIGKWITFKNGIILKEVNYINGCKEGYERIYNTKGTLLTITEFSNNKSIKDFSNISNLSKKNILDSNGLITNSGLYLDGNKAHGVHRNYDSNGYITSHSVFKNGVLLQNGSVDKMGRKHGKWVSFYSTGEKLGEGYYEKNAKIGKWLYFYKNGHIENYCFYSKNGQKEGFWKVYYSNGFLCEEITYLNGVYNGLYKSYNDSGKVIIQGNYNDNYKVGKWFYKNGSFSENGSYVDGKKTGEWRSYHNDSKLIFKGTFENGLPIGEHIFWYLSGNLRLIGKYISGRKNGEWIEYSKSGKVFMITNYSNGLEKVINGYKINPQHDSEDYIEYEDTGYK
mgnify:CR=1 FL=1